MGRSAVKTSLNPPVWPPSDPETEAAIGRLVLAWGVLELQIDLAIGAVYQLSFVPGMALTANLGTKAKLEICQAGIHVLYDRLTPSGDIRMTVDALVSKTSQLSTDIRLIIAHGYPVSLKMNDGSFESWLLMKHSARKGGLKARGYELEPDPFDKAVDEVKNSRGRVARLSSLYC